MAGGIDWFRWHHGSVTDPKFALVAKRAKASLPEVLAVWTYLLEKASAADFRGCFGEIDAEAVDCLFGLEDGATDAILAAMVDRKLIADEYIVAWEKRQPKREREDSSAERMRAYRERQAVQGDAQQSQVTPRDATQRQEKPRGEESREEQIQAPPASRVPPADAGRQKAPRGSKRCPESFDAEPLRPWAAAEAPRADFGRELAKFKDHTFQSARSDWEAAFRNWLRKASDEAHKRPASFQAQREAEAAKWMVPQASRTDFEYIDMEATNAAPLALR